MKLRYLFFGGFILALAGCTDTPDSVCLEYRNTINEALDALTMITDERTAARMRDRILKPLGKRFEAIENKLKLVRNNRTKEEFATEVLQSDGVQMYLAELEINKQRFSLEITRLRTIYAELAQGKEKPAEEFPALDEITSEQGPVATLRSQLTQPKLLEEMSNMSDWKLKNYGKLFQDFTERRKKFVPEKTIRLVD